LALSYIDPSGVTALKLLNEDFNKIDITIYIAGISGIILKGHNLIRLNVLVTNICIKYSILHKGETKSEPQIFYISTHKKNCHIINTQISIYSVTNGNFNM
jgi:hypothetical protein